MAVQPTLTCLRRSAMIVLAGEPPTHTAEGIDEDAAVTALEIPPPTVTMFCDWNDTMTRIECSGSASNGVPPYTYQWQMAHDLDADPAPGNFSWRNGTTTFSEPCKYGLYTYGRYYTKYIRFRVLDANTYVSTYVEDQFLCWTPNP